MKPTLEDLEKYKHYLIKNQLFDAVKEKIAHSDFDKIVFNGDYQYDDESSYYFDLLSVSVFNGENQLAEYSDDYQFLDQCSMISNLLSEWQESYTLLVSDLEEPFVLEKK